MEPEPQQPPPPPPPQPPLGPEQLQLIQQELQQQAAALQAREAAQQAREAELQAQVAQLQAAAAAPAAAAAAADAEALADRRLNLYLKVFTKTFNGEHGKADTELPFWIEQAGAAFETARVTGDAERVRCAACRLTDRAARWYFSIPEADRPATWAAFCDAARAEFLSATRTDTLYEKMTALKQTGSAAAYAKAFANAAMLLPDTSESDKMRLFKRGLKEKVRGFVAVQQHATLRAMMAAAVDIDDVLFEASRGPGGQRSATTAPRAGAAAAGPVPMELGTMATPKKLTAEERAELLRTGGCFACRQPGHTSAQCPRYPKAKGAGNGPPRRQ